MRCSIFLRGKERCAWCGCPLTKDNFEVDHIIPRALGGTNKPNNLCAACSDCNGSRWHKEQPEELPKAVTEQAETPITAGDRYKARTLAIEWYPWYEERCRKNREKQVERDRKRRGKKAEVTDTSLPF